MFVLFFVLVLTALPLSRPASAAVWTPDKCDPDVKYWCYAELYEPYALSVTIETRWVWGGLGNGGGIWWQRHILQDWQNSSGSWTFLGSWAPGDLHYVNAYDGATLWRNIANEAVVRNQIKIQPTSQGSPPPPQCDPYIDWHVTSGGYYWSQGPTATCLGVI